MRSSISSLPETDSDYSSDCNDDGGHGSDAPPVFEGDGEDFEDVAELVPLENTLREDTRCVGSSLSYASSQVGAVDVATEIRHHSGLGGLLDGLWDNLSKRYPMCTGLLAYGDYS